jgi:hypothetical protein
MIGTSLCTIHTPTIMARKKKNEKIKIARVCRERRNNESRKKYIPVVLEALLFLK